MTDDAPETVETEAAATPPPARRRRRLPRIRWKAPLAVILALLILVPLAITQGAKTDPGRAVATRLLNSLNIGRFGKLHVEGLQGDLFHDFAVRRVTIQDPKGAWIEIQDLAVVWRLNEILARRFHADRITATSVRVLRRPQLRAPGPPGGGNPLGVVIDELKLRLETLPAFSSRQGLWDVAGQFNMLRRGPASGRLDAQSRLHAGDGLTALFRFGDGRILLRADAVEGKGGALAGSAGLDPEAPFYLQARVDGGRGGGTLTVSSKSGSQIPVRASGRWSDAGATLDGLVVLAASRLTERHAARIGPQIHFVIGTRKGRDDLYDVNALFQGQYARLDARGPVDWRKQAAVGMQLNVSVAELNKWVHPPNIGPTRASGVFNGNLNEFVYKGRLEGQKLTQNDYLLARFAGPATLTKKKGDWRLEADLKGQGGAGNGVFGALLGPSPTVMLDGGRLADGRFMFRRAKIDGTGIKLDAEGGQDVLRGLSFKGQALLFNLPKASPGAKGEVQAEWSARQARGAPAWSIAFDAKGQEFATGLAELDRILGASPRVVAEGAWGGPGIDFSRLELTGAEGQGRARGLFGNDTSLAFDVDWTANGPFTAGPVEVAGQMAGTGKVGGRLLAPALDLGADLASIDFGRLVVKPAHLTLQFARTPTGADGRVGLTGDSPWGKASARSAFRFVEGGVELTDLDADAGGVKAAGAVALMMGTPSSADLKVSAGPGAFLTAGSLEGSIRLVDARGGPQATIALDGKDLSAPEFKGPVDTVRLRAEGPWAKLPYTLAVQASAPLPIRFAGSGVLTQATADRELTMTGGGRMRRIEFKTLEPARLAFGPSGQKLRLRLDIASGRADVDADLAGDQANVKAVLANLPMSALSQDFVGRLNANLALAGRGKALSGTLDANLDQARNRDAPENLALAGFLKARLNGPVLHLDAGATNSQGLKSSISADLPAEASAAPFRIALVRNRPLKGQFAVDGELRPLWDLFAGADRTLSGRLVAQGELAGALASVQARGTAELMNGRFEDVATGLNLQDLDVHADFGENAVVVREFTGADGRGGSVSGDGRVSLLADGASTLTLKLQRFQLIQNSLARALASGSVTVTRDAKGQAKLAGALVVDRADITAKPPVPSGVVAMEVVEINKPRTEDDEPPAPRLRGPPVNLDVAITARRGVYVKGSGLNVEMSLDSHVGGTITAPLLTGTARVVVGDYDFAGKRFDFDERSVIRLGSTAETIRLDLIASRDDPGATTISRGNSVTANNIVRSGGLTAVVRVQGTAAKPIVTLSSVPVLPQDEVLAQVLFGHSASQLSSFEAAQLASALTSLATGGGFDVVGGLRQFARLDRLAFGGGESGMAVSGGKYLTNDIYVELTGGGREDPSAQVEWRVKRNLSVVSSVSERGNTRLSVRFRKAY